MRVVGARCCARPALTVRLPLPFDVPQGCEFEAFVDVAERSPATLSSVCSFIFEVHFNRNTRMELATQLRLIARFWDLYIIQFGFRLWHVHRNPGFEPGKRPAWGTIRIPQALVEGLDPNVCCYENSLHRPGCAAAG